MNLLHLQKQKGDGHLFIASFPGWEDVPFKLPNIRRSQQFSAALVLAQDPFSLIMVWEQIFRECVVDEDLAFHRDEIPAGVVESLSKLIIFLSGLDENTVEYTRGLYNTYRSQAMVPLAFMRRIICSVFGGYTYKDLEELDYQEICEIFVQAERLMIDDGVLQQEYELLGPGEQAGRQMADADEFTLDAAKLHRQVDGVGSPRPAKTPAVQEAMREARMTALRDARIKAAKEQAQRTKNK